MFLGISDVAFSFNGERHGFIVGGGLGPAVTFWTQWVDSYKFPTNNDFNLHTDFRLGYGFNGERFTLFYWNKVSWFSMLNVLGENVLITSGVTGPGLSYYLRPKSPSLYALAGIGISVWNTPFELGAEGWYGLGAMGGIGFEFAKHWCLEATATYGKPSKTEMGIKASTEALSAALCIVGIAY